MDWTKPIQTRNGEPARVLCTDLLGDRPVVVAVSRAPDLEVVRTYPTNGYFAAGKEEYSSGWDIIINVPTKHTVEVWVNIYPDNRHSACLFTSKETADENASPERIACIRLTGEYEV